MNRLPEIQRILAAQLGIDESQVTESSKLVEDLDVDSLDTIELAMAFEEAFDIDIPDPEMEACVTVADLGALLDRLIRTESKS